MKDCKKIHPLLPLYQDGSLSSRDTARVEAHLKECADARKELEGLKRLREVMVALPEPRIPNDLHQRIMAKVQGRPLPLPRRPFWVLPAGAMAVAAVLAVFLFVQNPGLMDFSNQKQSRFSAEQVNRVAENQRLKQADEVTKPQPKPTAIIPQNGFAPSQPAGGVGALAKDQKNVTLGPMVQTASLPKAKMSRAYKKSLKEEVAMDKTAPVEGNPGEQAEGASAGHPSTDLAFTGSTTVQQALTADYAAKPSLPASSTNLPEAQAPSAAAPPAETPTPLTSWSGSLNSTSSETQELVTDSAAFQKDWQALQPNQAPPTVDFATQSVIVLMDQERPTAGYSIHVTSLEDKPDQLVVHYQVQAPAPGAFTAQVLTRPWALQIIPKPTKPVVFQKD